MEVRPQGRLLLYAKSEAGSRADFLHADFLEPDALQAGAFKRPETGAQRYRHDINMKLVDESSIEELPGYARSFSRATGKHYLAARGFGTL